METPGHHLIPLVEEAVLLAASYNGLLSQPKVAAFPPSSLRLG